MTKEEYAHAIDCLIDDVQKIESTDPTKPRPFQLPSESAKNHYTKACWLLGVAQTAERLMKAKIGDEAYYDPRRAILIKDLSAWTKELKDKLPVIRKLFLN